MRECSSEPSSENRQIDTLNRMSVELMTNKVAWCLTWRSSWSVLTLSPCCSARSGWGSQLWTGDSDPPHPRQESGTMLYSVLFWWRLFYLSVIECHSFGGGATGVRFRYKMHKNCTNHNAIVGELDLIHFIFLVSIYCSTELVSTELFIKELFLA